LIAREAGVVITDAKGEAVDAPMNVSADVAWIGYANAKIREQIEPQLTAILRERGMV
jgi:hypothetical protein